MAGRPQGRVLLPAKLRTAEQMSVGAERKTQAPAPGHRKKVAGLLAAFESLDRAFAPWCCEPCRFRYVRFRNRMLAMIGGEGDRRPPLGEPKRYNELRGGSRKAKETTHVQD
jgi:hypothetical protein